MDACLMWAEGTHITFMALNHDDGTFRLKDGNRADQAPLALFKDFVMKAREDTLVDEGYAPHTFGGLMARRAWYKRKVDQIVPAGDRDGSSLWTAVEKAGAFRPSKAMPAYINKTKEHYRMYTFDENYSQHYLHYGTVGEYEYNNSVNPQAIMVEDVIIGSGSNAAEAFKGEVKLHLGGAKMPIDLPMDDMGFTSLVFNGLPGEGDCIGCGGWGDNDGDDDLGEKVRNSIWAQTALQQGMFGQQFIQGAHSQISGIAQATLNIHGDTLGLSDEQKEFLEKLMQTNGAGEGYDREETFTEGVDNASEAGTVGVGVVTSITG